MRTRVRLSVILVLALLVTILSNSCAAPGYYWQAARGHLELMGSKQDIDAFLASADADPEITLKVNQALKMLEFARSELDLETDNSFSELALTHRSAITWNVIATPELSLEAKKWCFLVAGCVPYRGYFDQTKARDYAAKLSADDLDTTVSPATAYSTLGWFKDPLTDIMLNQSEPALAGTLFHELAHQRLYVRGDARFNEAYASFVEDEGTRRWLLQHGSNKDFERWQKSQLASEQFVQMLRTTRDRLVRVYGNDKSAEIKRQEKSTVFEQMRSDYQDLVDNQWEGQDYYRGWMDRNPNNADLALIGTYLGGRCAFESLFSEAGEDMQRFHEMAHRKSDLNTEQRSDWLQTPCD